MRRDIISAIISLAQSGLIHLSNGTGKAFNANRLSTNCILENTQVILQNSLKEYNLAFKSTQIRIPSKVRDAVLKPLDHVPYGGVGDVNLL